MKYMPIIAAIFLTIGKASAQEDDADTNSTGFGARVAAILDSSLNALQNTEIPAIGSGAYLSTLECDETTRSESTCSLPGGLEGVNACRMVGGAPVTICAPKVLGNYVGAAGDVCGCCGELDEAGQRSTQKCAREENSCLCDCQEGRGILVKHNLFKAFGRQISWNGCYTPTIAANVLAARPEFSCYDDCEAAVAAREAAAAAAAEAEEIPAEGEGEGSGFV